MCLRLAYISGLIQHEHRYIDMYLILHHFKAETKTDMTEMLL
jgi:hypothetical protein